MRRQEQKDIIQYLVENGVSGKVKIQKAAYFIQEALQVPLGYDFVMHYYGPYAFEIDDMLTEMQSEGILRMTAQWYQNGLGYSISKGKNAGEVKLSEDIMDKAQRVASFSKKRTAEVMELCATIHFVKKILEDRQDPYDTERIIYEVKRLKPKFSEESISKYYQTLEAEGLLAAN